MSRVKTFPQECGCEWQLQEIPRSMHTREIWTKFCLGHDAEDKAFRAEAQRGHDISTKERALREEFT